MRILILGTHWVINVTYFDSFVVEHVLKEIKVFLVKKTYKQIFLEYKHIIQYSVDIFVLYLLLLFLQARF